MSCGISIEHNQEFSVLVCSCGRKYTLREGYSAEDCERISMSHMRDVRIQNEYREYHILGEYWPRAVRIR